MFRCLLIVAVLSLAVVTQADDRQCWALLIGVDDYAYAQKLSYCGGDQQAFRERLLDCGFPDKQVFLLSDQTAETRLRPSRQNIERHLELVIGLAAAEDLLVIAFSGHGVHLDGKSFLCPGDCSLDDPASLVCIDDIYERLKGCAARFKLVLVDACRNDPRPGGSRAISATPGTRALAAALQNMKLPEGVVLLNSCAPGEVSWEDEQFGHGVFMHYVLDGLQGAADANGDAHVSLMELQEHAGTQTKAFVADRHRTTQRPFFKGDLSADALTYALLPIKARPAITVPTPVGAPTNPAAPVATTEPLRVESVKRITTGPAKAWQTDLARYQGSFVCAFREGAAAASMDGVIRLIHSSDAETWAPWTVVTKAGYDLRDPKLCLTPSGDLMLTFAATKRRAQATNSTIELMTHACVCRDGRTLPPPQPIGQPMQWLWQPKWHNRTCFAVAYSLPSRALTLFASDDGRTFAPRAANVLAEGEPTEAALSFDADGQVACVVRRNETAQNAALGTATPPYKNWRWMTLDRPLASPNLVRLADGRLLAASRSSNDVVGLYELNSTTGATTELLRLPSAQPCGYPGLVYENGALWISYYSSHEKSTGVYLAKVPIK